MFIKFVLFFEVPYLLTKIVVLEFKGFILRLQNRILRYNRGVLLIKQRNALLENSSRAMLIDKTLNTVEKTHENPNGEIQWLRSNPLQCRVRPTQ